VLRVPLYAFGRKAKRGKAGDCWV